MINTTCVIVGASHAGVNCAFGLRKEGWQGKIILIDSDTNLPYHRPPLSKAFLTNEKSIDTYFLKPDVSYQKEGIDLVLGSRVAKVDKVKKEVLLSNGASYTYDKLVLATGASPIIPPIKGIDTSRNIFPLRTAQDVLNIKTCFENTKQKKVVIIGGGYIGLEIAASLIKLGSHVVLLERENRLLARVTSPAVSEYFQDVHQEKGVAIFTSTEVCEIKENKDLLNVHCIDHTVFEADMVIYGVGVRVNSELAIQADLEVQIGIVVNEKCQTSDSDICAIGDNTYHYNFHYNRHIRLESVQNAVDQAKNAAKAICGDMEVAYDAIPWFWSDQYDLKLQMVGLIDGFNEVIVRIDPTDKNKRSAWFFDNDKLLAVQAINDAKAYVHGTKLIKEKAKVDKILLKDTAIEIDFKRLGMD